MVVSYPANPVCGRAPEFSRSSLPSAKKYQILILHDNAYSEIIYDGREGLSFESARREGGGRGTTPLSKTYNLTGARISFVLETGM